ncbi:hypothetical protein H311_00139 [Anncaliia algerae PRA109]|nr:hypothetical protein H311_00139 [Anncaliia algerae PRA109]
MKTITISNLKPYKIKKDILIKEVKTNKPITLLLNNEIPLLSIRDHFMTSIPLKKNAKLTCNEKIEIVIEEKRSKSMVCVKLKPGCNIYSNNKDIAFNQVSAQSNSRSSLVAVINNVDVTLCNLNAEVTVTQIEFKYKANEEQKFYVLGDEPMFLFALN